MHAHALNFASLIVAGSQPFVCEQNNAPEPAPLISSLFLPENHFVKVSTPLFEVSQDLDRALMLAVSPSYASKIMRLNPLL